MYLYRKTLDERYGAGCLAEFIEALKRCQDGDVRIEQSLTDRDGVLLKCSWGSEEHGWPDYAHFEWVGDVFYVHWLSATCAGGGPHLVHIHNDGLHERVVEHLPPFARAHGFKWVVVEHVTPAFVDKLMSVNQGYRRYERGTLPRGLKGVLRPTGEEYLAWRL